MIIELTYQQFDWLWRTLGVRTWVGRAVDTTSVPVRERWCIASSEAEADRWARETAFAMYDKREGIIR